MCLLWLQVWHHAQQNVHLKVQIISVILLEAADSIFIMPKHLSENDRSIIIHLYKEGRSQRDIATAIGCSKNGVLTTIKRWEETSDVKEREGRGKVSLVTPRVNRSLVRLSLNNRSRTSPHLSRENSI